MALYTALAFRVTTGCGLLAELIHELEETAELRWALAQGWAGRRRRCGPKHRPQRAAHQLPVTRPKLLEQPLGLQVLLLVHQPPLSPLTQDSS